MRLLVLIATLAAIAAPAAAAPSTAAERGKAVLQAQVAALVDSGDFVGTFAPGAVVLVNRAEPMVAPDGLEYFDEMLMGGSPHTDIRKGTIKKLTIGGTADVIVIVAELALAWTSVEPGFGSSKGTDVFHLTELVVDVGGTPKVIAAAFEPLRSHDHGSDEAPEPMPGATAAGPLTPLLASPSALAAALGPEPTVAVLGTGKAERAIGPARARKLLKGWSKLSFAIEGTPREVRTSTYGFTQAHVRLAPKKGPPLYFRALLIAVPSASGGWKVVAAQYVSPNA